MDKVGSSQKGKAGLTTSNVGKVWNKGDSRPVLVNV